MASNMRFCGVCDSRRKTKQSVVWCAECTEGLCGDCEEHHSVSVVTRGHETVSIAECKTLPTDLLKIEQFCTIHSEKYEFLCGKHDCLCCKKCVETHNDCKDITDINKIKLNVKASNAFYEMEQTLLEVVENIKRISTNRKDNLNSLKSKKIEIEAEIYQTRTKINDHLDKLQNDMMKELMATEQKEKRKIKKLLTNLKKKGKEIAEYQSNIAYIKQYASELQTFLTIKHMEKGIAADEKYIRSIAEDDSTKQINISYHVNKFLQQITTNVQKFGEIKVSSNPCDLPIQKRKVRQAQIMVTHQTGTIDNMTLTLQKRISTELLNVRGCSLLPGGKMVFSCFGHDKIEVFKSSGSKECEINDIGPTYDVVFIGDDCIAVTSGNFKPINIIDLKQKQLKNTIKVNSVNDGVVYKDSKLIYCAREKGLQMISLNDEESITNVTNNKISSFAYVATFGNKLFYTSNRNDSVNCCDYQGNTQWIFSDRSILRHPLGISVDNDGNVFVVGLYTGNLVVVSPDGQRCRQLLSSEDGLSGPQVLDYDQSTNKLLVANADTSAFLYDVTKM